MHDHIPINNKTNQVEREREKSVLYKNVSIDYKIKTKYRNKIGKKKSVN